MPESEQAPLRASPALIRLAQLLFGAISNAAVSQGLSALQIQILMLLADRGTTEPVGFFARRFMVTTATVSDSIRVLEAKGLIKKARYKSDARSVHVGITDRGRRVVTTVEPLIEKIERVVAAWNESQRSEILPALLALIGGLQGDQTSCTDRTCLTCDHFAVNCDVRIDSAPYYCRSLGTPLRTSELRLDCDLHQSAATD